jgi:hypothetical protein
MNAPKSLAASLHAALSLSQETLLALLPLLPARAQERLELWAPVLASLARLISLARNLIKSLAPLLADGQIDQHTIERFWADALDEAQSLTQNLPEAERWLDGLELLDGWAERVMADTHGMSVITNLLARLEVKINAWVAQIIDAMMTPDTHAHPEVWLARLAWAERVVQRFLDEIIMPRVFHTREGKEASP